MNNWDPSEKTQPPKPKLRVEREHGGENVEEITPEMIVSVNDANCTHDKMVRDHSETEFIAFMCANDACGIIKLLDK